MNGGYLGKAISVAACLAIACIASANAAQLSDAGVAMRAGDYNKAASIYRTLAEQGDPKAQASLGTLYSRGLGVNKSIPEAIKWWTQASHKGDIHAKTDLGVIYYNGDGVPRDFKRAFQYFSSAAAENDAGAQYVLGLMYEKGQGVSADSKQSYIWLSLATDHGLPLALKERDIVARSLGPGELLVATRGITKCKASNFKNCTP